MSIPMRRRLAALLVLATLPYLTLKIVWLTGSPVGLLDPAMNGELAGANAVTAALDVVVVALAVVFATGRRVPAWTLVGPLWIGIGLLIPTTALLASTVLLDGSGDFLAPWVRPMVYGGFTAQAVLLTALFLAYARGRWAAALRVDPTAVPVARTLARGGATVLAAVGVTHLVMAEGAFTMVIGALLLVGAAGALALTERGAGFGAVAAAWLGTGAATGWGLFGAVLQLSRVALVTPSPVSGLLDLAQLLAGGVTAVAVLLVLADRTARADQPKEESSVSASKQV